MNYEVGSVGQIPVKLSTTYNNYITNIVKQCICISKLDWNSFETSLGFPKASTAHPQR